MEALYTQVLSFITSNYEEFIYAFAIIAITFVSRKLIVKFFIFMFSRTMVKLSDTTKKSVVDAFEKPLRVLIIFIGLYVALVFLPFEFARHPIFEKYIKVIIIITFAYGLYHMDSAVTIGLSRFRKKINFETSEILKKFMLRVYHLCIVLVAITVSADQFGIDISSVVAGLGIAGLAIALAAQDTLSNIFGGVTLIIDKPFDVDDLIRTGDVEGVVEDIGFRSTRVRRLTKERVTIPNSLIANSSIINYTQRNQRRVKMIIGVTYNTSLNQIKNVINEVEAYIKAEHWVDTDSVLVNFDGFGPSSKDIRISFIINSGEWVDYLTYKQESCFGIMEIFEKNDVGFAFPSQSIYFENELSVQSKEIQ